METKLALRYACIAVLALAGTLFAGGNGSFGTKARAQDSHGSSRDGESRDERRERYRRYMEQRGSERGDDRSGSDRGRDWRGRGGDDSRRDGASSSGGSSSSSRNSSTSSSSEAKPASTANSGSSSSSAGSMNMKDYATSLVKQFDKNGDMMLQKEEQKELKGKAAESDNDHDGVITIDELVAHLSSNTPAPANPSTSGSTPGTNSSSPSSSSSSKSGDALSKVDAEMAKRVFLGTAGGKAASTKEGDQRKSYRFSKAGDHLPSSLPSWFKLKDKNGNGQVEMSEYSSSWSKSAAEEFRRYDKNDDGVITPKEAAGK